jgi:hypothetical protein
MKNVKVLSAILHLISKAMAVLYIATACYAALVFLLAKKAGGSPLSPLLEIRQPGQFVIMLPFTHTPFLLGDYTTRYILPMLFATAAYGIFAWLLGDVFKVFKQEKLFTRQGVRKLTLFYWVNLVVPPLILILSTFFTDDHRDFLNITILHGIIGIFAFFMASIFNQGVALQDEQDYTL